jgi:hypothetical protein
VVDPPAGLAVDLRLRRHRPASHRACALRRPSQVAPGPGRGARGHTGAERELGRRQGFVPRGPAAEHDDALWLVFFADLLVLFALLNWLPSLFVRLGMSTTTATLGGAVFSLGGFVGGVLMGVLLSRTGRAHAVVATGFVVGIAGIAVVVAGSENLAVLLVGIALAGGGVVGGLTGISAPCGAAVPGRGSCRRPGLVVRRRTHRIDHRSRHQRRPRRRGPRGDLDHRARCASRGAGRRGSRRPGDAASSTPCAGQGVPSRHRDGRRVAVAVPPQSRADPRSDRLALRGTLDLDSDIDCRSKLR